MKLTYSTVFGCFIILQSLIATSSFNFQGGETVNKKRSTKFKIKISITINRLD